MKDAGTKFPLLLYMERDPRRGKAPEQLHLLACTCAPRPVQMTIHPGAFAPRRSHAGPVQDPGRRHMMWQEAEGGQVTFQVGQFISCQAHVGADIYRQKGTLSDWKSQGWELTGTLGTEGKGGETPEDDIPETWAALLRDEQLLEADVVVEL